MSRTIGLLPGRWNQRNECYDTAFVLMCSLPVWEFSISSAWAQSAASARLIEGAKKEGQLNWYTSMSVVDHTKYLELFNKKYPFIKVNVRRVGGERLITIITTEYRAGKTIVRRRD